ncbi:TetR family transcriptional regulator [Hoyosella sp. YIM 151337]|uniref:TetR family transcriptional regulator n=1 Tax=Hoyosella sp. YIM 151337 TaxID=2992742 RepID=UPI002235E5C7|nr:TetR family transcriptional regulator [Hoyosella sp. YIM 151337]MCW4353705.1 TetR family transcriptional regulator [Hoyosella sp. YIM 151337]
MRAAGEATRERILAAAVGEFAEYGFAGARINRIAAQARASKDRLYAYFESKDDLYAAVTARWVAETVGEAALSAADLPGYAGRLFDSFLTHPRNLQLQMWIELESPDVLHRPGHYRDAWENKLTEIRRGQAEGVIDPSWHASDLLLILTDVPRTLASAVLLAEKRAGENLAALRASRRAAAVEAARRLTTNAAALSQTRR